MVWHLTLSARARHCCVAQLLFNPNQMGTERRRVRLSCTLNGDLDRQYWAKLLEQIIGIRDQSRKGQEYDWYVCLDQPLKQPMETNRQQTCLIDGVEGEMVPPGVRAQSSQVLGSFAIQGAWSCTAWS